MSGIEAAERRTVVDRVEGRSLAVAIHWLLRLACAACFVGHGAWGIYRKAEWLPFYRVFSIPDELAVMTMPLIGSIDILMGVVVLYHPSRALLAWMTVWAIFTAFLRPLAGQGWWEFIERGGNYAPPLALWVLSRAQGGIGWLSKIEPARIVSPHADRTAWILRVGVSLLLIGHGGFAAFEERQMLVAHWSGVGVDLAPVVLVAMGWVEIVAGVAVLVVDSTGLLVAVAIWKTCTEFLYPMSGGLMDVFEWVERGGDYLAPLVLILLLRANPRPRT